MGVSTNQQSFFFCRVSKIGNGWYRRWTMKSNPCCIVVNPRTPKFQCCLWAARLGPVDKKIKPWTQRKLDRVLCNIEIWGVGFYLVDVCGCFFCPSTVGWLVVIVVYVVFCWCPMFFVHISRSWWKRWIWVYMNLPSVVLFLVGIYIYQIIVFQ